MKKRRWFRIIFLVLLLIVVLIQFLPVDRSVPTVNPSQDFVAVTNPPAAVATLIKQACYDCHSYETEYPWYSYISPVAQWLQGHVNEGREKINFSIWTTYSAADADEAMEEAVEEVGEKKVMPLKSFTWTHPEARLTDAQRTELTDWFRKLRTGASGNGGDEGEEAEGE